MKYYSYMLTGYSRLAYMIICAVILLASSFVPPSFLNAQEVYVITRDSLKRVNIQSGVVSDVAVLDQMFGDIAFHPDGNLYGSNFEHIYMIDTVSGVSQLIYSGNASSSWFVGMTIDHNGVACLSGGPEGKNVYALHLSDLSLTDLGAVPYGHSDLDFFNGELLLDSHESYTSGPEHIVEFSLDDPPNSPVLLSYWYYRVAGVASVNTPCGGKFFVSVGGGEYSDPKPQLYLYNFEEDTVDLRSISSQIGNGGMTSRTSHYGSLPPMRIDSVTVDRAPCDTSALATVVVHNPPGRGGMEYSIDGISYQESDTFLNVMPGTYQAFIQDSFGCTAMSDPFVIPATAEFDVELAVTPSFCDLDNGTLYVESSSGGLIDFAVDNQVFESDTFFTDLSPGGHVLYMRHAVGCEDSIEFTIDEIPPVETTITTTPEYCDGMDGTVSVSTSGGQPPYVYRVNNSVVPYADPFDGYGEGQVIISVTDDMGCEVKDTVWVDSYPGPDLQDVIAHPTRCDTMDGMLEVIAQAPGSLLFYSINDGIPQSSPVFDGLAEGQYKITVMDTFGCISEGIFDVIALDGPEITDVVTFPSHCEFADGALQIEANGGNGPLSYYVNGIEFDDPTLISGLFGGPAVVEVIDSAGCSDRRNVFIGNDPGVMIDTVIIGYSECDSLSGAYAEVVASSTGVMEYSWDGIYYQLDARLLGQGQGDYVVYVRDEYGCVDMEDINIENPFPWVLEWYSRPTECGQDGLIGAGHYASFGPYEVSIDGVNYTEGYYIDGLGAGQYTLYVRSQYGCVVSRDFYLDGPTVLLSEDIVIYPPSCGALDGRIEVRNNDAMHSYAIDGREFVNNTLGGIAPGIYDLIYTDTSGCIAMIDIEIPQAACNIYLPNVFSPNADGINDTFGPVFSSSELILDLEIVDRWGSTVYSCQGDCQWDGNVDGQFAPAGVYVYVLRYRDVAGEEKVVGGDVTLVR